MTDEIWRPDDDGDDASGRAPGTPGRMEASMDDFDDDEFGGPLFGDTSEQSTVEPVAAAAIDEADSAGAEADERLSLDTGQSEAMPHWTEAATGEVPRIEQAAAPDPTDDLDVWSTFTSDAPVWKEGDPVDRPTGQVPTPPADPTGEIAWEDAPAEDPVAVVVDGLDDSSVAAERPQAPAAAAVEGATPAKEPPARITIGTDPSGMPRRPQPPRRGGGPRPPSAGGTPPPSRGRDLPVAVATGLVIAAVFLAATIFVGPVGAMAVVVVALGLAAIEYFSKVTEKGYRPAVAAGVLACITAPLVAYWVGAPGLPLAMVLAFMAGALGFIAADSIEVGPMPNMAITMLGVVWIGLLGSYAALIIRFSNLFGGDNNIGTDTLVLLALGVVANDVGAYFSGSAFGRTPLRRWISPNKSVEGFLGGTILTLVVLFIVGLQDASDTWSDTGHLLMLGIVISLFAPMGDLTESMFKRNLDVKDFGAIVRGHGGVLDRFDGFLFALPAVYYLMRVIEPWTAFAG